MPLYGGGTQVGGTCTNCYYTQAQYSDIVAYAQSRYITLVPEIDMPGHTNAALASYAELNCNGVAPARYTGTNVGFSSLCISKPITYTFVDDVIRELAALTPGAYIHVGGDEGLFDNDCRLRELCLAGPDDCSGARQANDRMGRDRSDQWSYLPVRLRNTGTQLTALRRLPSRREPRF